MTTGTEARAEIRASEKKATPATREDLLRFKKRMLAWDNPVEFVNNMYGCHPDGRGNEYFREVFK